ncbi:MAG: BlaI/MecI/CopY family transcriptional regulator [Planctomycetia bacterium]|nr:BlaI/MecI/CopY family transcriptional regulator [Planctomycetia bacterium]
MAQPAPSDRELDILKVLWKLGEARVRDVHETLCQRGQCAFTTVQTFLRIMAEKGLVSQRAKGRTLYYKARYSPQRAAARFLHKVFDGSVDQLVLSMLAAEDTSADELKQLEKLIGEARKKKLKREES